MSEELYHSLSPARTLSMDKYQASGRGSGALKLSFQSTVQKIVSKGSRVLETPPATAKTGLEHFSSRLAFEIDPSDVHADLLNKVSGILIIDPRTPESYAKGHVLGAINLPYRTIDSSTIKLLPRDKVLVTYCDGVFCNASTKAAAKLTALGFQVKEMLDGMHG